MIGRLGNWIDRALGEAVLTVALRRPLSKSTRKGPRSIVVLRNNDLGDVLIVTPLFEALRRRFPEARICAAVGSWAQPLLVGNPHLSGVLSVDAPWFNKYARKRGPVRALRFAWRSRELARTPEGPFDLGIDVLGSVWGALLLVRTGIPMRLGTRGYAGGERGFHDGVIFDPDEHVGRRALRFAELLGATDLPENRPQLFLSRPELEAGERAWEHFRQASAKRKWRIAIGPGAGLPQKAWPVERFRELVSRLAEAQGFDLMVLGGPGDRAATERIAGANAHNLAGEQSLRAMIGAVSAADCVVCNSSLLLHAAAAFGKRTIALLGPSFPSAAQHQRQWGYDGYSVTLGPEREAGQGLATVERALATLQRAAALPPGEAFR